MTKFGGLSSSGGVKRGGFVFLFTIETCSQLEGDLYVFFFAISPRPCGAPPVAHCKRLCSCFQLLRPSACRTLQAARAQVQAHTTVGPFGGARAPHHSVPLTA